MSKRRKVFEDIPEVMVEAIVWRDAQRQSRERFDPEDRMVLISYGPVIYEGEDSIWIASEHRYTPEFMRASNTENHDRTEILKSSIIKRVQLGKLKMVDETEEVEGPS